MSQLPMMVSAASFVDGFQLALRLQDDGCRNLTAADGGDQLIKLRDQTDVRKLIEQQPHMILQLTSALIVRSVTKQVEKLGVHNGHYEIERIVRVGNNNEQGRAAVPSKSSSISS